MVHFFAGALVSLSFVGASTAVTLRPSSAHNNFVKGKYIVQLAPASKIAGRSLDPHDDFHVSLARRGVDVDVTHSWKSAPSLFYGVAVTLADPNDLAEVFATENVQEVWPVRRYAAPQIDAQVVSGSALAALNGTKDEFTPHIMMGVNKLQDAGYFGKGITVGIIDSGIDWTHPALGGGYGPGFKVADGYDFSGDVYNGVDNFDIIPDNDPFSNSTCGPHGTHVAGIIGANSTLPDPIFTGVAPQATLHMYRVFGCKNADGASSTEDPMIIDALLRAYADGSDIITLSLGGPGGWSESSAAAVASNIVAAGRIVTISQGNSGSEGVMYASSPASGKNVWSVGSLDNLGALAYRGSISDGTSFDYYTATMAGFVNRPIYILNPDTSSFNTGDACTELPASTPDLSPYIVVIKRGTCTFAVKYVNVAAKGAQHVFIYNNAGSLNYLPDPKEYGLKSASFLFADVGAKLVALAGTSALVSANDPTLLTIPQASGGKMSGFSSYGANWELDSPSPLLSAPGGSIFSTWPIDGGGFALASGTSMACPAVAGSAALWWSIRGKKAATPLQLRDIFGTTATPVLNYTGTTLESVIHAGAGAIDVYSAVYETVIASPGFLLLNDTEHLKPLQIIKVKNSGKKTVTVSISHTAAGTVDTFESATSFVHPAWPVALTNKHATVYLNKKKLTLAPGQTDTVIATFKPPSLKDSAAPFYSGFINIGSLSVPYYGLATTLKSLPILDKTDVILGVQLPVLIASSGASIPKGGNTTISASAGEGVQVAYRLVSGSRVVRIDVVKASAKIQATLTKRSDSMPARLDADIYKRSEADDLAALLPSALPWVAANSTARAHELKNPFFGSCFDAISSLGFVSYDPYLYRSSDYKFDDYFTATFKGSVFTSSDKTKSITLPPGSYKLLIRALKLTGNPALQKDYESWLSPTVILKA